jgi:hypothetical protein
MGSPLYGPPFAQPDANVNAPVAADPVETARKVNRMNQLGQNFEQSPVGQGLLMGKDIAKGGFLGSWGKTLGGAGYRHLVDKFLGPVSVAEYAARKILDPEGTLLGKPLTYSQGASPAGTPPDAVAAKPTANKPAFGSVTPVPEGVWNPKVDFSSAAPTTPSYTSPTPEPTVPTVSMQTSPSPTEAKLKSGEGWASWTDPRTGEKKYRTLAQAHEGEMSPGSTGGYVEAEDWRNKANMNPIAMRLRAEQVGQEMIEMAPEAERAKIKTEEARASGAGALAASQGAAAELDRAQAELARKKAAAQQTAAEEEAVVQAELTRYLGADEQTTLNNAQRNAVQKTRAAGRATGMDIGQVEQDAVQDGLKARAIAAQEILNIKTQIRNQKFPPKQY